MHTIQSAAALCPWKAALYIRLSRDDGNKLESNSVTNQKEILREHLKLHPDIHVHDIYIDDGWSGTNFNRPGFIRMTEDIYAGKVNCVVVKDLSRFCRNASEGGRLEILLNFQDELQTLTDYLDLNREALEDKAICNG